MSPFFPIRTFLASSNDHQSFSCIRLKNCLPILSQVRHTTLFNWLLFEGAQLIWLARLNLIWYISLKHCKPLCTMINCNIISHVICKMWNVRNVKMLGMFKIMYQLQAIAEFASNLTANICLFNLKAPVFLLADFEQVFYEIFFGGKSNHCFTFL